MNKEKQHERETKEVALLNERIGLETPERGTQVEDIESFDLLPLSTSTKNGLKRGKLLRSYDGLPVILAPHSPRLTGPAGRLGPVAVDGAGRLCVW